MKTANSVYRNNTVWLQILYCLVPTFCFALAGCQNDESILQTFSRLEEEALKYGAVSAGAARVMEYNCSDCNNSRRRLREALCRMRCKWLKDPNDKPQGYLADYAVRNLAIMLGFNINREEPNQKDSSKNLTALSEVFKEMMSSQILRPSEIELIGFYMAAQKFVESELEELNLGESADQDFRRFVISLDLTAWVRGEAKAALVYIDLYPYQADSWCEEAAKMLKKISKKAKYQDKCIKGSEYKKEWTDILEKELGAFATGNMENLEPPLIPKTGLNDYVASCHRWLEENSLRPRIIQVERMGQSEYLISGEGNYSGSEFQLGGAHPAGPSGSLKTEKTRMAQGMTATVRPLSLAFIAGERRAGWLFMPGKTTEGSMAPTERRLRMVVDVPKDMERLGIHVHKLFLDDELGVLSNASFAKQIENLDHTRAILNEADACYEKYKATELRHYRLIKTRIRNLLHQGWSEETVVDIPKMK